MKSHRNFRWVHRFLGACFVGNLYLLSVLVTTCGRLILTGAASEGACDGKRCTFCYDKFRPGVPVGVFWVHSS